MNISKCAAQERRDFSKTSAQSLGRKPDRQIDSESQKKKNHAKNLTQRVRSRLRHEQFHRPALEYWKRLDTGWHTFVNFRILCQLFRGEAARFAGIVAKTASAYFPRRCIGAVPLRLCSESGPQPVRGLRSGSDNRTNPSRCKVSFGFGFVFVRLVCRL